METGLLYYAPVGTPVGDDAWVPLGTAEDCDVRFEYEDPLTEALYARDLNGHCASVSFPVGGISAYGYWVLFRRRHPKISAMRRAYRRKVKNRS